MLLTFQRTRFSPPTIWPPPRLCSPPPICDRPIFSPRKTTKLVRTRRAHTPVDAPNLLTPPSLNFFLWPIPFPGLPLKITKAMAVVLLRSSYPRALTLFLPRVADLFGNLFVNID